MAAVPAIPNNFLVQQGNGNAFLSWDSVPGAVNYTLQNSLDGLTFADLVTQSTATYLDTTVTIGTKIYYRVCSNNTSGSSSFTNPQSVIPTNTGDLSLAQIRLMAKQRADMVNSPFVTDPEWNTYINQVYFELYDLLVTVYEDYFLQTPYVFQTNGAFQYTLPTDFYKLLGVDAGLANNNNAWATLKRFEFEDRNQYVFPQLTTTLLGIYDLRYKLMGNTLYFIPTPATGSFVRVWYIPKLVQLLRDNDIATGISGWLEYVIVSAAILALIKQESDASPLLMQKEMLIKRIEESSMNRDAGSPACISDSRRIQTYSGSIWNGSWGGF